MLRITANENPRVLTFRLEGRLEGPCVSELDQCWRSMLNGESRPTVCVDLTGVTYIDAAGGPGWRRCTSKGPSSLLVTA